MSQPILAPAPAYCIDDAAHRDRDLRRLLALWRVLAARCITAQAHPSLTDEAGLAYAVAGLEDALHERHRQAWQRLQGTLQDLLVAFQHADPAMPAADCITCRRIAGGLPVSVAELVEEASR